MPVTCRAVARARAGQRRQHSLDGHAANLRNLSQSVRNPTTWFQLGIIRDAGPEIRNGLGAFLCRTLTWSGFRWAFP